MNREVLDRRFDEITFVSFDTETTGRDATRARVIEIAAVRARGLSPPGTPVPEADCFQQLVRPDTPIPRGSTRMHGIEDEHVRESPRAPEALRAFFSWLVECGENVVLMAHNASFDIDIISCEAARAGMPVPEVTILDTLTFTRRALPGLPGYSLEALCRGLSLPVGRFHRALDDSRITMDLFRYCAAKAFGASGSGAPTPGNPGAALDVLGDPLSFKPRGRFSPDAELIASAVREAIAAGHEVTLEVSRGGGASATQTVRPLAVYPAPEGALAAAFIDIPGDTEEGVVLLPVERVVSAREASGGQGLLFG